jgi:hypothetical protein
MTMHLMGPAYSTTSTKKRKNKPITIDAKFARDFKDYNKLMRRYGSTEFTLEQYVAYRQGKLKPALRGVPAQKYEPSDHRQQYPSGDGVGVTVSKKPNVYTGSLIRGIATMHKSNAVPVINEEQAIEISRMRRG